MSLKTWGINGKNSQKGPRYISTKKMTRIRLFSSFSRKGREKYEWRGGDAVVRQPKDTFQNWFSHVMLSGGNHFKKTTVVLLLLLRIKKDPVKIETAIEATKSAKKMGHQCKIVEFWLWWRSDLVAWSSSWTSFGMLKKVPSSYPGEDTSRKRRGVLVANGTLAHTPTSHLYHWQVGYACTGCHIKKNPTWSVTKKNPIF